LSQDTEGTLFDFLFVSVEFSICEVEFLLKVVDLDLLSLFLVLELALLFFKALLDIQDLLFLGCKRPTHLCDLMLELFLKLDDSLLPPLEIERSLPHLGLQILHASQRLVKSRLSVRLLELPAESDLLDLLDLPLLQVGFKLSLFSPLPHL
jgi:hypothetical protein